MEAPPSAPSVDGRPPVRRRGRLAACLTTLGLSFLTTSLGAQSVRGTVVRPSDSGPVAGVVVLLVDARDAVVARALTNERGEYRVAAPAAGTYRERTLRIGYRPYTSEPFVLSSAVEVVHRLSLENVAFAMDTVRVVSVNACRVRTDTSASTYAIWAQVRAALTATQIASGDRANGARVVTYERTLDADGRRILAQQSTLNRNYSARAWLARPVDALHRAGYVTAEADGGTTYYAPDLDVLLSDSFLDDHCFRIARGSDARQIGLEFEPSRERRALPDIRGTVWLNRATSELDRLEFRYANVSREQEDGGAGGSMTFVRMSNGAWAIARWHIQMPVLERRRTGGFVGAASGIELRVAQIQVAGGELALMMRGRDTLWARAPLVLTGSTVDSATSRPLVGARVSVIGTPLSGTTGNDGRFSIPGMLPGVYAIEIRTPSLDAVGAVYQSEFTFTDSVAPLRISVPGSEQIGTSMCGASPATDHGIVTGRVAMRGDTVPPRGLGVLAEWTDIGYSAAAAAGKPNRSTGTRTDQRGRFWLCGLPLQKALVVRLVSDSISAEPVALRITDGMLGRADLVADRLLTSDATFAGVVVADSTNQPLSGTEVSVADLGLTQRTNAQGQFRFGAVAQGAHRLIVRHVGYGPLDTAVVFGSDARRNERIVLSRITTLDSVRVVAKGTTLGIGLAAFEERRRLGFGKFIDSDMLRKNEHRHLEDVLRALSGVATSHPPRCTGRNCENAPSGMQIAVSTRMGCYYAVLLDGVVVGKGGAAGKGGLGPDWTKQFDMNAERIGNIEAVEVYRSAAEIPVAYGGTAANCGVILLWSRQAP